MKHADRITEMTLKVEFKAKDGRGAWIECKLGMPELTNPLATRAYIDEKIDQFDRDYAAGRLS